MFLEGRGIDTARAELRALELATAEARLDCAKRAEARALSEGDSAARLLPEIDTVDDGVAEDARNVPARPQMPLGAEKRLSSGQIQTT